jgi:transcriptional regulator with XRE-family HTH domain
VTTRISTNVRFLLWRRDLPRSNWEGWLASRCSIGVADLRGILQGRVKDDVIGETRCADLAHALDLDSEPESLRFNDFVSEGCDVLRENLIYLLGSLGHGGKKALAGDLDIDPTTISRWLNGASQPIERSLRQITAYFGMPNGVDLRVDPLFLSIEPVALSERRRWLMDQLKEMPVEKFRELYPALRRLLEGD